MPELKVLPLKSYGAGQSETLATLSGNTTSTSVAPKEFSSQKKHLDFEFPEINARIFIDAIAHCHSSAITASQKVLIPDYFFENRTRVNCFGGNLLNVVANHGIVEITPNQSIGNGIALFGVGSANYYHWLIEVLPCAMLAQLLPDKFEGYPFLVPQEYEIYPSFRDSLEVFRANRSVITLSASTRYHIDSLIAIDSPSHCPFNLSKNEWPRVSDYKQNGSVLTSFRNQILSSLSIDQIEPRELIFLARGNSRRDYNQDEIVDIAKAYGFSIVYPEALSFADQVRLFYGARFVVGPSGAGWANIIFSQRKSLGLTWVFPEYKEFCSYSNLANIVGMNLGYIFTQSDVKLRDTVDAYRMSYWLDPEKFENEIKKLLGCVLD